MASTHALTLVGAPQSHWLFSGAWLPNGWATVVFVVLSGFGIGYIYSARPRTHNGDWALWSRSLVIFVVMVVSNIIFAVLRLIVHDDPNSVLIYTWWLGFLTLETPWTISGVLLPTALVILFSPILIFWIRMRSTYMVVILLMARAAVAMLEVNAGISPSTNSWGSRFFIVEGFGGFPVLPFFLNGCLGVWIGVQRQRNESLWGIVMVFLLLIQLITYLSTFEAQWIGWTLWRHIFGPVGKFAFVFVLASIVVKITLKKITAPLCLIGRFALTSFVVHRIFLHIINLSFGVFDAISPPVELRYALLLLGTLFLTWVVCKFQELRNFNGVISLVYKRAFGYQ